MNLQQFSSTKKFTKHLPSLIDHLGNNVGQAYYYLNDPNIYIEVIKDGFSVIIGNQEFISWNIKELEKELYDCIIGG